MPIPLNILFSVDITRLSDNHLKRSVDTLRAVLGGFDGIGGVFCHVMVSEANKAQFPDIIDFLYDAGVKPLVSKADSFDPYTAMSEKMSFAELDKNAYTLVIAPFTEFDYAAPHFNSFHGLIEILSQNKDMITIDILGAEQRDQNNQRFGYSIGASPLLATLARTRDLYLAAKIALTRKQDFVNIPYNNAFSSILGSFSQSPYRHLGINPFIVTVK
jgi:hypothetical protein